MLLLDYAESKDRRLCPGILSALLLGQCGYTNRMPCLILILAALFPRFVMIMIAIFTNWFSAAFDTVLWPILGFLFMPYTTLAYMAAMLNNHHTANGGWLAVIIIAALIDLGGNGGSARGARRYRRQWKV
jgi:hypothetical protein